MKNGLGYKPIQNAISRMGARMIISRTDTSLSVLFSSWVIGPRKSFWNMKKRYTAARMTPSAATPANQGEPMASELNAPSKMLNSPTKTVEAG